MQPGMTVALAMVWLACMVGVISTTIPLRPSVDQYSPQMPENYYGVARGSEDHVNRKYWRTLQALFNVPINQNISSKNLHQKKLLPVFKNIHQDEATGSVEVYKLDLPIEKLSRKTPLEIEFDVFENIVPNPESSIQSEGSRLLSELNISDVYPLSKVLNNEMPNPNFVPELQVGCEGQEEADRQKRSDLLSDDSRYFIQEVDPRLLNITPVMLDLEESPEDGENGQFYEETDELLRLREQERKSPIREIRGDIQVNLEDSEETAEVSDVPLRGDIGAANALARAQNASSSIMSSEAKESNKRQKQNSTLSGRHSLRKREAIDFPRNSEKVESPWGYGEEEGADPLREARLRKGKRRKKPNKGEKKHQRKKSQEDNRWRVVNRSHRKNLQEDSRKQRLQEEKLRNYIRKNTPKNIRENYDGHNRYVQNNRPKPDYSGYRSGYNDRYHYSVGRSQAPANDRTRYNYQRLQDGDRRHRWDKNNRHAGQDSRHYNTPIDSRSTYDHQYRENHNTQRSRYDDYSSNQNPPLNFRAAPSSHSRKPEDDYILRNTPIDIRRRPNYNSGKPYKTGFDRGHDRFGNIPGRTSDNTHPNRRRGHNFITPVDKGSRRKYEYDRVGNSENTPQSGKLGFKYGENKGSSTKAGENSGYWPTGQRLPLSQRQGERVGHAGRSSQYENGRLRLQKEKEKEQERKGGYQEYKRKYTHENLERLHKLPVDAQIVIDSRKKTRISRDVQFATIDPVHKGPEATKFPTPATKKPPVEGPSLCIWAVIKCCPSNTRRKACFDAHGCLGADWDPDPCKKSIIDAARAEIMKFYATTEF